MTVSTVLASVLLGLTGLLLVVALVPFHARASGSLHEATPEGTAQLEWGWGLFALGVSSERGLALRVLGFRVLRLRRRRVRGARGGRREERRRERKRRRPAGPRRSWPALRQARALLLMAAHVARTLRLRLRVQGIVGTGDPADTALLAGLVPLLEGVPGVDLELGWEWLDEELELDAQGSARIWLAHLLCVVAALLLARENRAALRAVIWGSRRTG